jgi:hypothetical protein
MPERRPYQRIVALIRFDAMDRPTAEKALLLARLTGAELDFLHLIEPDGALDGGYPGGAPGEVARALVAASLRRLAFLAAQLDATEARCHAVQAPPRQGFLRHVQARQPDLVVTGEPHDYLAGPHDVLILSPATRTRRRRLLAWLTNGFRLRTCSAGV